MAGSKCPKCDYTGFEVEIESPRKSNFKLMFVRCASCKTVVGVLDYWNIGTIVKQIAEKLGIRE